jgi:prolyl-tRNA editing enzyme YbaK/EbsC (Cys-tRNA(Pro) deacylase)
MIPAKVQACLDEHQLSVLQFEPGSTPTSELAASKIGVAVGQIAKSMLFKAKDGRFHLVVCAGDRRVCNKRMRRYLGVKARMATVEETLAITGFEPGGVCPFGVTQAHIHIDVSLAGYQQVYPAAGTDSTGVPTNYPQLLLITAGETCDVMQEA